MRGLTTKPDSDRIAANIADAEAKITAADTQVPALRTEDARLESQITELIGEQIAEGDTRNGPAVAAARERRRAIATEIEETEARAAAARIGIAQARRVQLRTQVREARSAANEARKALAPRMARAAKILRELSVLSAEVDDLAATEQQAWRRELDLRTQLDARDGEAPPHAGGDHLIAQACELLALEPNVDRQQALDKHLDRMAGVAQTARELSSTSVTPS